MMPHSIDSLPYIYLLKLTFIYLIYIVPALTHQEAFGLTNISKRAGPNCLLIRSTDTSAVISVSMVSSAVCLHGLVQTQHETRREDDGVKGGKANLDELK